jgi:hypothetical protein
MLFHESVWLANRVPASSVVMMAHRCAAHDNSIDGSSQ